MKRRISEPGGCLRWITVMLLLFIFIGSAPASAGELPDCRHVYVDVSNENGPRFSDHENGSYYLKFDGGGLNALHLTTDTAVPRGQVTTSDEQSGVFYITDTGGRGYSDNTVLMLAVNGTIPDDFALTVRSSGYVWEPVSVANTLPALADLEHSDGTMEETFTKEDFLYGPQTWKPAGNNLPMAYPICFEQDTSDTDNTFQVMFIDLKAGPVSKATGLASSSDLTDSGGVKVEYSFKNLETFAAFNAYVWCNQSNQGQGISWTNRVSGSGSSVYQVVGIPPELTSISVSPETSEVTEGEGQQFTAIALDQNDRTMNGITFAWTSSDETVGTVSETGYFTALTAGTTTITATNESIEGEAAVTVVAEPSGPQPLPDYNHIFVKVANDGGVKYNAFENNTYNIRFEGINRGLNALHISTDPAVNFGQVTVTENQSGSFYATDSGGKGYEDEIILMLAVNGTISDDFSVHVEVDGYTWTPNPESNRPPSLDDVIYQSSALDEVFTKEDFRYGPQIWKPTGNECDYPIYGGQDLTDTGNTFQVMFIDLNAGVLRPNADLENRGAVRVNYTFENLETFAAFNVYGYCQNSNNGDNMVAWSNALTSDKAMSGYSVVGDVSGPVTDRIEVEPTMTEVAVGDVYHFAATAFDALNNVISGLALSWASSNETVGTIDESGNFTALTPGTTNVTASHLGIGGTSAVTVVSSELATWYVDGSGSGDFTTIQAAINAAKAGDTIIVRDGTYTENVDVTKSLIIRSENGSALTTLYSATKDSGFDITSGNVTLDGFTIAAVNGKGNYGIYVHGANGALIANNTVQNCRECVKIESSSGNTVTKNILSVSNNAANNVFWLADASNNSVYLNEFNLGAVNIEGTSAGNVFQSPTEMQYAFNGADYQSYTGNYWNGYTGSDANGNGIGDDTYTVAGEITDEYPLIQMLDVYTVYGPVPEATTYYVDDDGGADFTTIQAAVDAAADGDMIVVRDGTYVENVDVTRSLVIKSENGSAVTTLYSATKDSGFDITAGDVTLDGFTITAVNGKGNYGIYVHGADGALIVNNTVQDCRECVKIESSSGNTVQKNILSVSNNAANNVFWLVDASNNLIYLNDFNLGKVTIEGTSSGNAWSSPLAVKYRLDGSIHTSVLGNHWNGYTGSDTTGDGIGEDSYTIADGNVDAYPLVNSQAEYVNEDLPEGITITIASVSPWVLGGETLGLSASAFDNEGALIDDATFSWTSSNTTVGTIGADGLFTAGTPGTTSITASYAGASASTDLTVVRTWYVDDSGSADFSTIQAAVDAAGEGDYVVVRDGTYNESVSITKPLILRSKNGPGKTIVTPGNKNNSGFTVSEKSVTIDGFGVSGVSKYGIYLVGGAGGCTITNNSISESSTGIYLKICDGNNAITHNTCNNNRYGINLLGTHGNYVGENLCCNNSINGIRCQLEYMKPGADIHDNVISGNVITMSGDVGLRFEGAVDNLVANNTIACNTRYGLLMDGDSEDNVVYANNFFENSGFYITNSRNSLNSSESFNYIFNGVNYTSRIGNYYAGQFDVTDADNDGIGDSPCHVGAAVDNYPLALPAPAYFGESIEDIPIPKTLEISPESLVVYEEKESQFSCTVYDQAGTSMTQICCSWVSSNETVGTISGNGLFTALASGETTITVYAADLACSANVIVEESPEVIVWSDDCESANGWTLQSCSVTDTVVFEGTNSIGTAGALKANSSAERIISFPENSYALKFYAYGDHGQFGIGKSRIRVSLDGEQKMIVPTSRKWDDYIIDISDYEAGDHAFRIEGDWDGQDIYAIGFNIDQIELRINGTSPSSPGGDVTEDVPLDVPGVTITPGKSGNHFSVNTSESAARVSEDGKEITINRGTFNLVITTTGNTTTNGTMISGVVNDISLATTPLSTEFDALGNVTASLAANLTGIPAGAALETTITEKISADARSAFQIAATADGLNLDAVAYTMNIVKTNLTNGEDISDATIRMAVSPAWVAANGGYDAVKIIRFAEGGTKEVLDTVYLGFDGELDLFEAFSPNGLSVFGLSATSVTPAPQPGFSSSSGGSGGASGSIATARCDGIHAGEMGTFLLDKTAITEVDVKAGMNIPSMMLTAEQISAPSKIDAAPNEVYQYIEITSYLAPEDSMEMATLKFSVDTDWLDSLGAAASDVKIYRYDEGTASWALLSVVPCGEDESCCKFFADTPSFSLFAITAEKGAAPNAPVDGSQPDSVSTDSPDTVQPTPTDAQTPAATGSTTTMVIIAVIAIIGVCGGAYWWKTSDKK